MTVEARTCIGDVQPLRMNMLSFFFWISDKFNMRQDYEFVLLLVRFIVCRTYLYRDVDIGAGEAS